MNYATIKPWDIANGPGVRVSLFVSGCTHHCKDCFNPEAWDFDYGEPFTEAVMEHILELLRPEYIRGITYLGGEPFDPHNQPGLLALTQKIRAAYPEKSICPALPTRCSQDSTSSSTGRSSPPAKTSVCASAAPTTSASSTCPKP